MTQVVERHLLLGLEQELYPKWLWDEKTFARVMDDPERQNRLNKREKLQQDRNKLYGLSLDLESLERG